MKLTIIGRFQFLKKDNKIFALPAYGYSYWEKYLERFDSLLIIGEPVKSYLINGSLVELQDNRISVVIVDPIERPKDIFKTKSVRNELEKIIKNSDCIMVKPSCRRGIISIKLCQKYNIPFFVELTGDVDKTLSERHNLIYFLYGKFLYHRIKKSIKKCQFGLYVTEQYLQRRYPISGEMCGCTDAIIPIAGDDVLSKRLEKIVSLDKNINIGLIGYYHDKRKGIDLALKAISILKYKYNIEINLHILGTGEQVDRDKWYDFSKKISVDDLLYFDKPRIGSLEVAKWIDTMDLIILPSRSEGFPRAIAESMSRACPTITSNVCGLEEMVDKKWQHKCNDYKELAQMILEMISDKKNMEEAALFNFNKSKNYSFDYLLKKRNTFFNNFISYCESHEVKK